MLLKRKLLILVTSIAFAFSVVSFVTDTTQETAKREAYFQEQDHARAKGEMTFSGPYCFPDRHPQFLLLISFLTGITLLSLFLFKHPFWPFLFSVTAFSAFPYWYFWTQRAIAVNETIPLEVLNRILYRSNQFDVIVFSLLSILTVWQLTILSGAAIQALKRENPLP